MKTIENNKIIAQFLGQKETISNFPQFGYMTSSGNWKDEFTPNELKFHKDWNWLMPVVEKIESVDNEKITLIFQQKSCLIWDNSRGEELEYFDGSFKSETKIEAVYTACVEFIKWYNEQNLTQ